MENNINAATSRATETIDRVNDTLTTKSRMKSGHWKRQANSFSRIFVASFENFFESIFGISNSIIFPGYFIPFQNNYAYLITKCQQTVFRRIRVYNLQTHSIVGQLPIAIHIARPCHHVRCYNFSSFSSLYRPSLVPHNSQDNIMITLLCALFL